VEGAGLRVYGAWFEVQGAGFGFLTRERVRVDLDVEHAVLDLALLFEGLVFRNSGCGWVSGFCAFGFRSGLHGGHLRVESEWQGETGREREREREQKRARERHRKSAHSLNGRDDPKQVGDPNVAEQ